MLAPRAEGELLRCCARVSLGPEQAARLQALLRQGVDWEYLIQAAARHGLMPLLCRHLETSFPEAVPETVLVGLRDRFRQNGLHNLSLAGELLQLLRLFAAHGIPAVPFKGPTLAALAYGDLALRQFSDLDILLRPRDLSRARGLLAGRGYRLGMSVPTAQEADHVGSIGQLPLVTGDEGKLVELHTRLMPQHFYFPLGLDQLWARLRPVNVVGKKIWSPLPEDLLLILCAHGAKHLWASLGWVCDVAELIRACPGLNWDWVERQAKRLHSERMLFLGLLLAAELLQAPPPGDIARKARADPATRALAARVCQRLFREDGAAREGFASSLFHFRVREHPRDGGRYALSLAVLPTVEDWLHVPLPATLSSLYYLLRPLRLAVNYGGKAFSRLRRFLSPR
jgi:hypothetical protein